MISIPVSAASHTRFVRVSRWLCVVGYLIAAAVFVTSAISGHNQAQAILKDAVMVQAPVKLDNIEESRRKGRTTLKYHFSYTFEANGVPYKGEFMTAEDSADKYLEEDAQVQIAYARSNPANFERADRLQGMQGLGAVLGRLCVALGMLAILAFVVHLLLTRKLIVPREPALPAA